MEAEPDNTIICNLICFEMWSPEATDITFYCSYLFSAYKSFIQILCHILKHKYNMLLC